MRALGLTDGDAEPAGSGTRAARRRLVALTLADVSTPFLIVTLVLQDGSIARRVGLEELGFRPGVGLGSIGPLLLAVAGSLGALAGAAVVHRRGQRTHLLLLAAGGVTASLVIVALATTELEIGVAVALGAASLGARLSVGPPLLFDMAAPERRPTAVSVYVTAMCAGVVVAAATLGIGHELAAISSKTAVLVLAGVAAVSAAPLLWIRGLAPGATDLDALKAVVRADLDVGPSRGGARADGSSPTFAQDLRRASGSSTASAMRLSFAVVGVLLVPFAGLVISLTAGQLGTASRYWTSAGLGLVAIATLLVAARRTTRSGAPARVHRWSWVSPVGIALGLVLAGSSSSPTITSIGLVLVFCGAALVTTAALTTTLWMTHPRLRTHAASLAVLATCAGVLAGSLVLGELANRYDVSTAVQLFAIVPLLLGVFSIRAGRTLVVELERMVEGEIERQEVQLLLANGHRFPLLSCRSIEFSYGQLCVLFGVDLTVDDGEIVALLGTNGAGKSTLLDVIAGLLPSSRGTIHFDGADITYLGAEQRCRLGIAEHSGGHAVFGSMSVLENLRMFAFTKRRDRSAVKRGIDETFEAFPELGTRRHQAAATLSGGEQQMLALGKALILRPRLLLIDELSLGLAPMVVSDLLEMVRRINAQGTSVVLVEQSVNVALSIVDHAYFLEKGEVRFDGAADELIARPDLVRSVFLEGATTGHRGPPTGQDPA